jgi:CheY-like chemotaxis protein
MAFQRLCREGANLFLRKGTRRGLFPLLAEAEGRIAVAITERERLQWNLEPGGHLNAFFLDRGQRFEATLSMLEPGSLDGIECYYFEHPRRLVCLDDRRFTNFVPHNPVSCVFSTPSHDVCEGRIRAMGAEGIELRPEGADNSRLDLLRVEGTSTIELSLGSDTRLRLEGTVAYFREGMAGIVFREEGAEAALRVYRSWLMDSLLTQLQKDREAFNPGGARTVRNLGPSGERPGSRAKIVENRDPMVLVISEGDALPNRLAHTLGRMFGFAGLDYLQGPVQPLAAALKGETQGWGGIRMILVHHRLRLLSGMELLRKLVEEEGCPLPILVAGGDEDLELKRERARSLGALDYVSVQPFRILTLKLALEEALRLPGTPNGTSVPARSGR